MTVRRSLLTFESSIALAPGSSRGNERCRVSIVAAADRLIQLTVYENPRCSNMLGSGARSQRALIRDTLQISKTRLLWAHQSLTIVSARSFIMLIDQTHHLRDLVAAE